MDSNILTYLRIKERSPKPIFNHNQIQVDNKTYTTDSILYGSNQVEMFQLISKNILSKCIQGYNCSVFAYGQTGSGKTYTIQGTESKPGLVQSSLSFLHNNYDELKLSFIEIYNETMIDLYEPNKQLNIREDPVEGVVVDCLTTFTSKSLMESLDFYKKGISNRKTAATQMNPNSSRSHSIFTIRIQTKSKNVIKSSKLCFVDLAGSEKINDYEHDRIKETCNINKSLLCLGKIVHKLSSNDKWHISYRDSKLTFLLKDSLGGNSVLAIIGTINTEYQLDTINTLNFLSRSKLIHNCPSINYNIINSNINELIENIKELDTENQKLKAELAILKSENTMNLRKTVTYCIKKINNDVNDVKLYVDRISECYKQLLSSYFEGPQKLLLKINEKLAIKSSSEKENLQNQEFKRRKCQKE